MDTRRKKKPGADLRACYYLHLQTAFIIVLIIFNVLFRMDLSFRKEFEIVLAEQETIVVEEILRTEQHHRPPPPPRPPAPVVVPEDEIAEDIFFDLGTDFDLDMMASIPLPPPPSDSPDDAFDEAEIFTIVENMPELRGGLAAVYERLHYPEIARRAGVEGRVIIQFVIDESGRVTEPVVLRGIGAGCDEAALEAVRDLEFEPGRQRGRPVKVRYSMPIIFRLSSTS